MSLQNFRGLLAYKIVQMLPQATLEYPKNRYFPYNFQMTKLGKGRQNQVKLGEFDINVPSIWEPDT